MKKFFVILVCLSLGHYSYAQSKVSLTQFKESLNDTIVKAMTFPNQEFVIGIKINDFYLTQIIACNEITRDSVNLGCVMTTLLFDSHNKKDVQFLNNFKAISLSKEYKYLYADMEMFYKNHSHNYKECIEYVIKILFDLYEIKDYSNIKVILNSPQELE